MRVRCALAKSSLGFSKSWPSLDQYARQHEQEQLKKLKEQVRVVIYRQYIYPDSTCHRLRRRRLSLWVLTT